MIEKNEAFDLLTIKNYLWKAETMHEAMRLCVSVYKKWPSLRKKIIDYIVKGPEDKNDYCTFRMLTYIKREGLLLNEIGEKTLVRIHADNPKWELDEYGDLPHRQYTWMHKNPIQVDEILETNPKEVALQLVNENDMDSKRDLCEVVGIACGRNRVWCLEFFLEIEKILNDIQKDTMNPILWRLGSGIIINKNEWDSLSFGILIGIIEILFDKRSDADLWHGTAEFIRDVSKDHDIDLEMYHSLAMKLTKMLKSFDYDSEHENRNVEWLQKAINHPLGKLTEVYLDQAKRQIQFQIDNKAENYDIDSSIYELFDFVVDNYDIGTRYGICLIAFNLNWFEVYLTGWMNRKLIPLFISENADMLIVTWSGFLWKRYLSKFLIIDIKNTYLNVVKYYDRFDGRGKKDLMVNVAGLAWFGHLSILNIIDIIMHIDASGYNELFNSWLSHLKKSKADFANVFFEKIVIPLWKWCGSNGYLDINDRSKTRFLFWKLLPFSYNEFPKAYDLAMKWKPEKITQERYFIKNMINEHLMNKYLEEYINVLIVFLDIYEHYIWNKDDLKIIWEKVKDKDIKLSKNSVMYYYGKI